MIAAKKPANTPVPAMRLRSTVIPIVDDLLEQGQLIEKYQLDDETLICSPGRCIIELQRANTNVANKERQYRVKLHKDYPTGASHSMTEFITSYHTVTKQHWPTNRSATAGNRLKDNLLEYMMSSSESEAFAALVILREMKDPSRVLSTISKRNMNSGLPQTTKSTTVDNGKLETCSIKLWDGSNRSRISESGGDLNAVTRSSPLEAISDNWQFV